MAAAITRARVVAFESALRPSWYGRGISYLDLERADRRMQLASRLDLPLILLAGLMMAIGRYL